MRWAEFEEVAGPLLIHERIDQAAALGAYVAARVAGNTNARIEDFLPHWGGPEEQTPEQQVQIFRALMKGLTKKES